MSSGFVAAMTPELNNSSERILCEPLRTVIKVISDHLVVRNPKKTDTSPFLDIVDKVVGVY